MFNQTAVAAKGDGPLKKLPNVENKVIKQTARRSSIFQNMLKGSIIELVNDKKKVSKSKDMTRSG